MKKWFMPMIAVPLLLVGCGEQAEIDTNEGPVDISELEVKVDVLTPKEVPVGETVELSAHVTQNKQNVEDAMAVEFEVWESGYRDKAIVLEGEHAGDGVYKAEYTFDHDGVYYMYAHTTARGLHVMPKHEMIVGHPDMNAVIPEGDSEEDSSYMQNMEN